MTDVLNQTFTRFPAFLDANGRFQSDSGRIPGEITQLLNEPAKYQQVYDWMGTATNVADESGNAAWDRPTEINNSDADEDKYAEVLLSDSSEAARESQYLRCSGFQWDRWEIPNNVTIKGVQVVLNPVENLRDALDGTSQPFTGQVEIVDVRLVKDGTRVGPNLAALSFDPKTANDRVYARDINSQVSSPSNRITTGTQFFFGSQDIPGAEWDAEAFESDFAFDVKVRYTGSGSARCYMMTCQAVIHYEGPAAVNYDHYETRSPTEHTLYEPIAMTAMYGTVTGVGGGPMQRCPFEWTILEAPEGFDSTVNDKRPGSWGLSRAVDLKNVWVENKGYFLIPDVVGTYKIGFRALDQNRNEIDYQEFEYTVVERTWDDVFHVTTAGNDSTGDGTEGNPFRSVLRALDQNANNVLVLVGEGEFSNDVPYSNSPSGDFVIRGQGTGTKLVNEDDSTNFSKYMTLNGADSRFVFSNLNINGYAIDGGWGLEARTTLPYMVALHKCGSDDINRFFESAVGGGSTLEWLGFVQCGDIRNSSYCFGFLPTINARIFVLGGNANRSTGNNAQGAIRITSRRSASSQTRRCAHLAFVSSDSDGSAAPSWRIYTENVDVFAMASLDERLRIAVGWNAGNQGAWIDATSGDGWEDPLFNFRMSACYTPHTMFTGQQQTSDGRFAMVSNCICATGSSGLLEFGVGNIALGKRAHYIDLANLTLINNDGDATNIELMRFLGAETEDFDEGGCQWWSVEGLLFVADYDASGQTQNLVRDHNKGGTFASLKRNVFPQIPVEPNLFLVKGQAANWSDFASQDNAEGNIREQVTTTDVNAAGGFAVPSARSAASIGPLPRGVNRDYNGNLYPASGDVPAGAVYEDVS